MQPVLPPKPTTYTTSNLNLQNNEVQPYASNLQMNDQVEQRTDLPFKTIPHDYVTKLFCEGYNNKLPNVPLPEYISWLPTSKIKEFANNPELIDGYIESVYQEDFKKLNNKINEVQDSYHNEALNLQKLYTHNFISFTNEVVAKNEEALKNLKNFDDLQIQMYDVLNGLSINSIINRYKKLQSENESKCSTLIDDALSKDLNDENLDQLLNHYKNERTQWHLNKTCVDELEKMKVSL